MGKFNHATKYPTTPDGHYFVVRNRLWRCTNPNLDPATRAEATRSLMAARRELKDKQLSVAMRAKVRARIQAAKEALGERGAVWWHDGGPICDRKRVENTPYKTWWAEMGDGPR